MKLRLEKTRAFWLYIVGGVIATVLGTMLLPLWRKFEQLFFHSWGEHAVYIMISGLLFAYILFYLVKRISRYLGTPAQIVAIVELVIMVVIAVICTVSSFVYDFRIGDTCQIFALSLWTRGVSGVFTGYYSDCGLKKGTSGKNKDEASGRVDDFTVWRLSFAVALITAGTYFFFAKPFDDGDLQWVFSCAIILVGLFFILYGIILKPQKKKEKVTVKETDTQNVKTPPKDKDESELDFDDNTTQLPKKDDGKKTEGNGKVRIQLDQSANAMTATDAYDALWDDDLPVPTDKK